MSMEVKETIHWDNCVLYVKYNHNWKICTPMVTFKIDNNYEKLREKAIKKLKKSIETL